MSAWIEYKTGDKVSVDIAGKGRQIYEAIVNEDGRIPISFRSVNKDDTKLADQIRDLQDENRRLESEILGYQNQIFNLRNRSIRGICPSCGGNTLVVKENSYLSCTRVECKDRTAADNMLRGYIAVTGERMLLAEIHRLSTPDKPVQ
jgi:excinuclease UvrABC ATPase subunit